MATWTNISESAAPTWTNVSKSAAPTWTNINETPGAFAAGDAMGVLGLTYSGGQLRPAGSAVTWTLVNES